MDDAMRERALDEARDAESLFRSGGGDAAHYIDVESLADWFFEFAASEADRREQECNESTKHLLASAWWAMNRSEWQSGPTSSQVIERIADALANAGLNTPSEIAEYLGVPVREVDDDE